jgi:hypothetical protein
MMKLRDGSRRKDGTARHPGPGETMSQELMSERTAELMLLLYDDGVDRDELKALVGSAFKDGIDYTIKRMGDSRDTS